MLTAQHGAKQAQIRARHVKSQAMGPSWASAAEGRMIAQFRQRQAEKEVCGFAGLHMMQMLWNRGVREMPGKRRLGLQVRTLLVCTHILVRTPLMVRIA